MESGNKNSDWEEVSSILPEAEERYRIFTGLVSDMVYSMKVADDGSVEGEWASNSFAEVMGYSTRELDSSSGFYTVVHPEHREAFRRHLEKLIAGGESSVELRIITRQGKVKWLQDSAMPLPGEDGSGVVRIIGAVKDITKRKEAEIELARSNRKLANLNELFEIIASSGGKEELLNRVIAPMARFSEADAVFLFTVDRDKPVLAASFPREGRLQPGLSSLVKESYEEGKVILERRGEAEGKAPGSALEKIGMDMAAIFPLEYKDEVYAVMAAVYYEESETFEWFREYIKVAGNQIGLALERLELLRIKAAREKELRELTDSLVEGFESERTELTTKLHDGIAQSLVELSMEFDLLRRSLPEVKDDYGDIVESINGKIKEVVESTREISYTLHPAMVKDLGLVSALESHAGRLSRDRKVDVRIGSSGFNESLPYRVSLTLYRIAQEALADLLKEPGVNRLNLRLTRGVPSVIMIIEGNGTGFKSKEEAISALGLGLIGIRARIEKLNGSLSIRTSPGKGTRIRVSVPVEVKDGEDAQGPAG